MIYASYHTQGHLFFWYQYQREKDLTITRKLARKIFSLTGFDPYPDIDNITSNYESYAGFCDWAANTFYKPAVTMEFAKGTYSEKDFDIIYKPGKLLPLLLAQEALENRRYYSVQVYIDDKLVQLFKTYEEAIPFINKYSSEENKVVIKNK